MSDRYTLLDRLGRGTMGEVWRAKDATTGDIVALKYLHVALADDPTYRERFAREVEIARRIDSPHVVKLLDSGERKGRPYLVLEYIAGRTLRDAIAAHGPYPTAEACGLLLEVASGLAAIHDAGVLHRDLKPANVLLSDDGVAKIADFGIAKAGDLTALTGTVTVLGTPTYLAPEGPKDIRSDLYGLGVVAYELLAGVPPFTGESHQAIILAHISTPPDLTKLPRETRGLVGSLLAKNPDARPQSARSVIAALMPLIQTAGPRRSPVAADEPPTAPVVEPAAAAATAAPKPPKTARTRKSPTAPSASTPPLRAATPAEEDRSQGMSYRQAILGVALVALLGFGGLILASNGSLPADEIPVASESAAAEESPAAESPSASPMAAFVGVCTPTGDLPFPLNTPVLQPLRDGRVLVFANAEDYAASTTPAIYDPTAGSFTATAEMAAPRRGPATFLLDDGRVLAVAGWKGTSGDGLAGFDPSVEIFDPATAQFTKVGEITDAADPWMGFEAVQAPGGSVAIRPTGGGRVSVLKPDATFLVDLIPVLVVPDWATSVLLEDGRVLFVGPTNSTKIVPKPTVAEIVDPVAGTHNQVAELRTPRVSPDLFSLGSGRVLVSAGSVTDQDPTLVTTVELLDVRSGTVIGAGSMNQPRSGAKGQLTPDGHLVVWSGWFDDGNVPTTAEVLDPETLTFTEVPGKDDFWYRERPVTLDDGRLLFFGDESNLSANLIVDPATLAVLRVLGLPDPVVSTARLPNGLLLHTAYDDDSLTVLYPDTLSVRKLSLEGRDGASATVLGDGGVLMAGGTVTGTMDPVAGASVCR